MAKELQKEGYKAFVVQGTFHLDKPICDEEGKFLNPLHYWVEIDGTTKKKGTIVDITAFQFQEYVIYDEIEKITIGSYKDLDRYKSKHRDWK